MAGVGAGNWRGSDVGYVDHIVEPVVVVYKEEKDRWLPGDRFVRPLIRKAVRPPSENVSGMQRVVRNFLKGLAEAGISYQYNPLPWSIPRGSKVISFGLGVLGVRGLRSDTPLIAAIGFPYPGEFPDLCERYNVRLFLQHSQWVLDWVRSANIYDDRIFDLWHAGIDTDEWVPDASPRTKDIDVLMYCKIHWDKDRWNTELVDPIKKDLRSRGATFHTIEYGSYVPAEYKALLARSNAMVFLSPHEGQGLAYQECLSSGVPVMAWNPGYWLDPARLNYGPELVPATSVPFFDERCGETFRNAEEFASRFDEFYDKCRNRFYQPRQFVLDNLTIGSSTTRMIQLYNKC